MSICLCIYIYIWACFYQDHKPDLFKEQPFNKTVSQNPLGWDVLCKEKPWNQTLSKNNLLTRPFHKILWAEMSCVKRSLETRHFFKEQPFSQTVSQNPLGWDVLCKEKTLKPDRFKEQPFNQTVLQNPLGWAFNQGFSASGGERVMNVELLLFSHLSFR